MSETEQTSDGPDKGGSSPHVDAPWLQFKRFGAGPADWYYVSGNIAGYQRLAERVQDAVENVSEDQESLDLNIDDIVEGDSDITLRDFMLQVDPTPSPDTPSNGLIGFGCFLLLALFGFFAIFGAISLAGVFFE